MHSDAETPMKRLFTILAPLAFALLALACSSSSDAKTDSTYEAEVVQNMHDTMLADLQTLHSASEDIAKAAPVTPGRGWDQEKDRTAIDAMTAAWLEARSAYERTEGAIAPLFPDVDAAIDERYDGFLDGLGKEGDPNLFDDEGVTGMHAIERILFAPTTPASVLAVEASLPGYQAAAWPATEEDATAFKTKLCARLAEDTQGLLDQWTPQVIDIPQAYQGLVDLMGEQREKVLKAASEEEESRYSQRTMADVRDNLKGTRRAYALFLPWLKTKADGPAIDQDVEKAFSTLDSLYGTVPGDAFPAPPATWSSETPSAADLQTEFGKLFTAVNDAVDPNIRGSAVDGMTRVAKTLGFGALVAK
jgi:iron uptake system component EfeO